ncbi:class A beta-lactamase [Streptomyces sp. NRRL F-5126]|uniref:class A beta-lactamase n=1 Tax=Streptomyces sp. NRRL F-5126 TaxID=1463857 RepID=UPI0004C57A4D|nr:class A beta-lactamase [Streptomyces sp. NRRL F-5126]
MYLAKLRIALPAAVLATTSALLAGCSSASPASSGASSSAPAAAVSASASPAALDRKLAALEKRYHAHVGLYVLDTKTGRTVSYHADRRFAHCSTIKALAAGVLLKRTSDARLDHVITYRKADLVSYSPITSKHVAHGMTLRAVITAALEYSDNTAENLMLAQLGGPESLESALRKMGDATTNADRTEPSLNDATPGDTRDTSTPRALGTDLRAFLLGDALPAGRRSMLRNWMVHNTTGTDYIRAGVPAGWKVGDKTGSGGYGTRNDIAIAWPPARGPVVISVLTDRGTANAPSGDALIADATRTALAALGG